MLTTKDLLKIINDNEQGEQDNPQDELTRAKTEYYKAKTQAEQRKANQPPKQQEQSKPDKAQDVIFLISTLLACSTIIINFIVLLIVF